MRRLFLLVALLIPSNALAAKQCGMTSQSCSAGPATILIDGMEVRRPCWENTISYACIDTTVSDTCAPAIARGCSMDSAVCEQGVTIDGLFQCITEQRAYRCKVADASSSTVANCAGQQFCVDGKCFDTGSVPDPDFARAVTGMEVAREAGVYIDESTLLLFKGQDNRCSKSVLQNCCRSASSPPRGLTNAAIAGGSAYLFDVLNGGEMKSSISFGFDPTAFALSMSVLVARQMLSCTRDEVLIAVRRDNQLCHYVGDYCARKVHLLFASICVQHKETHCCFNSKISRIINEAARIQLPGVRWGSPESPSCQGLSIGQFQAMDLSRVDFSEFYADIKPTALDRAAIVNKAADTVKSYFGH